MQAVGYTGLGGACVLLALLGRHSRSPHTRPQPPGTPLAWPRPAQASPTQPRRSRAPPAWVQRARPPPARPQRARLPPVSMVTAAGLTDATDDDKRAVAGPGAAILPRFATAGVVAEHDTPSQALQPRSDTPSPEAADQSANSLRTAGTLLDFPPLVCVTSSVTSISRLVYTSRSCTNDTFFEKNDPKAAACPNPARSFLGVLFM